LLIPAASAFKKSKELVGANGKLFYRVAENWRAEGEKGERGKRGGGGFISAKNSTIKSIQKLRE